jgi:hypothetical protein
MKYEEIERLLQYNSFKGYESDLFMPNEIFTDLKNHIENTPHIAFAYSYTYLVTWLYRHFKYTNVKAGGLTNSDIKEILGYKPETRSVNKLITKNGLLDKIGYTETTRNFPVSVTVEDGSLEFTTVSEIDDKSNPAYSYEGSTEKIMRTNIPNNYTIKYPVKAFKRTLIRADNELELEGTFYDVDYTHNIPFEVFMYSMSNEDIGCTGFYLYAYLKHKNDIYANGYDVSLENLANETGIAERTLDKYLGMLKGYKMIEFQHNQEFFVIGLKDRKPNTYTTNEYISFKDKPVPFQTIPIIKKKDYFKMMKQKEEELDDLFGNPDQIDIPLEQLPY